MLLALGAASSALDILKSLTSPKSSSPKATGLSQDPANPFDLSGSASASASTSTSSSSGRKMTGGSMSALTASQNPPKISPAMMSALLAAQDQSSTGATYSASNSRTDALKDLFSQLDADGDGQISKSEFEDALGAGGTNLAKADDVFGKLDKDGNGTVSLDEMSSALNGAGKGHSHRHAAGGSGDSTSAGSLQQALQGASSTSVTNGDGSITTSLTYADGSKVTMTSAAGASSAATSSYNFIEQMIAREAKAISAASTASLSVSA